MDILYVCAISNLGQSYARKLAFSKLRLSIGLGILFSEWFTSEKVMLGCLERSHAGQHKLVTNLLLGGDFLYLTVFIGGIIRLRSKGKLYIAKSKSLGCSSVRLSLF